jgi:anaphase-promoting complex subunit 8
MIRWFVHQTFKFYKGRVDKAIEVYEDLLRIKDEQGVVDRDVSESLLYLAKQYKKTQQWEKAALYAKRLYDFNGPER